MSRKLFMLVCLAAAFDVAGTALAAGHGLEARIRERISLLERAWNKGDANTVAGSVYGKL